MLIDSIISNGSNRSWAEIDLNLKIRFIAPSGFWRSGEFLTKLFPFIALPTNFKWTYFLFIYRQRREMGSRDHKGGTGAGKVSVCETMRPRSCRNNLYRLAVSSKCNFRELAANYSSFAQTREVYAQRRTAFVRRHNGARLYTLCAVVKATFTGATVCLSKSFDNDARIVRTIESYE